jgi:hypothetical protein
LKLVDDVENYFNVRIVKGFHHRAELAVVAEHLRIACVLVVRREKVQRHVAPVIAFLRIALKHRHQLDHRDPEVPQIRDLLDQTRVGTGAARIDSRVRIPGETFDVKFVDDGVGLVAEGGMCF